MKHYIQIHENYNEHVVEVTYDGRKGARDIPPPEDSPKRNQVWASAFGGMNPYQMVDAITRSVHELLDQYRDEHRWPVLSTLRATFRYELEPGKFTPVRVRYVSTLDRFPKTRKGPVWSYDLASAWVKLDQAGMAQ